MIIYGTSKAGIIHGNVQDAPVQGVPNGKKKCRVCGSILPLSMFHRNKTTKDGLRAECKACFNRYQRRRYQKVGGE